MGSSTLSQWARTLGIQPSNPPHLVPASSSSETAGNTSLAGLPAVHSPSSSPLAVTSSPPSLPLSRATPPPLPTYAGRRISSSELGAGLQPFVQWLHVELPASNHAACSASSSVTPTAVGGRSNATSGLPRVSSVDALSSSGGHHSTLATPSVTARISSTNVMPSSAHAATCVFEGVRSSSIGEADVSPGLPPLSTPTAQCVRHIPTGGGASSQCGLTCSPSTTSPSNHSATSGGCAAGASSTGPASPIPLSNSADRSGTMTLTLHNVRSLLKFIGVKPQFATDAGNLLVNALTLEAIGCVRNHNNSHNQRGGSDYWTLPNPLQQRNDDAVSGTQQKQQHQRGRKRVDHEESLPPQAVGTMQQFGKLFVDGYFDIPVEGESVTRTTTTTTTSTTRERFKKEMYAVDCVLECIRLLSHGDEGAADASVEGYPAGTRLDPTSVGFVLEMTLQQFQAAVRDLLNVQRQMVGSSTQEHLVSLRKSAVAVVMPSVDGEQQGIAAAAPTPMQSEPHSQQTLHRQPTLRPNDLDDTATNDVAPPPKGKIAVAPTARSSRSATVLAQQSYGSPAGHHPSLSMHHPSNVTTTQPKLSWGLPLSARRLDDRVKYSLLMQQRGRPMVVLAGGTSGCGKSTLAHLLANRLGISTVISTDGVRELLRTKKCPRCFPELFASTYEAHKQQHTSSEMGGGSKSEGLLCRLHASARSPHVSTPSPATQQRLGVLPTQCTAVDDDDVVVATGAAFAVLEQRVVRSFERQCKLVLQVVDELIRMHLRRGESVLVEGVHLLPEYCARLTKALNGPFLGAVGLSSSTPSNPRTPVHNASSPEETPAALTGSRLSMHEATAPPTMPHGASTPTLETVQRAYECSPTPSSADGDTTVSRFRQQTSPPVLPLANRTTTFVARSGDGASPPQHAVGLSATPILCISLIVHIVREEKHLLRFAIRSKSMTLKPQDNKYVANFNSIRWIQKMLVDGAHQHNLLLVNNTNVDKSLSTIQAHVLHAVDRLHAHQCQSSTSAGTAPHHTAASGTTAPNTAAAGMTSTYAAVHAASASTVHSVFPASAVGYQQHHGLEDVKGKVLLKLLRVRRHEKQLRRARSADALPQPHSLLSLISAGAPSPPPAAVPVVLPGSPAQVPSTQPQKAIHIHGAGSAEATTAVVTTPNTPQHTAMMFPVDCGATTRRSAETVESATTTSGNNAKLTSTHSPIAPSPLAAQVDHRHHHRDATHLMAAVTAQRSLSADASNPRHARRRDPHHSCVTHPRGSRDDDGTDVASTSDATYHDQKDGQPSERSSSPATEDDVCSDEDNDRQNSAMPASAQRVERAARRRLGGGVALDDDDDTPSLVGS